MEADTTELLAGRHAQTRYLRRFVLREISKRRDERQDASPLDYEIASRFLDFPSLENVHHLCLFYSYTRVRSALVKVESVIFEEFFYGKIFLYPLWLKRFSAIFDAARPRTQTRELLSNQE